MKTLPYLLTAVAVTIGFTLSAYAGEPLSSPRAKDFTYSPAQTPNVASHLNLVKIQPAGNARAWELDQSVRTVPSTGPSIDFVHASRPTLSPKDPCYAAAWQANAQRELQITRVK